MRYQFARVVLGACLVVASAAAQGTAASSVLAPEGTGSFEAGLSRRQSGDSHLDALRGPRRFDTRAQPQDQVDYTLVGQFRLHHGEFMDRYERYDPNVELRARAFPNMRIGDEPGSFDLLGYDVDVEFPVVITTEAYLLFGVYQYGRRYLTSSDFGTNNNPGGFGDETLTAAGVRLGFGWFLADNVLWEVETNPGAYSDLDSGLKSKDYDFPSSTLFTVRTMDNFFFKIGARYSQVFEDAPWLPMLGFSWEVVDGFRIDVLAPEMVEMSWWPSPSTSFAFGAFVQGAQYHVRTSEALGRQRADVQIQEVVTYLGLTQRFSDNVSLQARAGLVLAGDYELSNGASAFDPIEGALDQGLYADVTFGIDW